MANMLYNGVELPDIEPIWEEVGKTAYPYAILTVLDGSHWGEQYAGCTQAELTISEISLDVVDGRIKCASGRKFRTAIFANGSLADYFNQPDGEWYLFSSVYDAAQLNGDASNLIWTSHDILNTDGSVFLAGSDPVDPNAPAEPSFDKTAFLSGLAMGLCGKGDPTSGMAVSGGGASGNYLYNGVELPDINTVWTDKETYPYSFIVYTNGLAQLTVSSSIPFYADGYIYCDGPFVDYIYDPNGLSGNILNSWSYFGTGVSLELPVSNDFSFWTSHDMLNASDNTVYLAASAPVPAGGTDAFLKGYLTGAELRRKRVIPASTPSANGDGFALYNGVKLPNIDSVWTDKETYPYVSIAYSNGMAQLVFSSSVFDYADGYIYCDGSFVYYVYDPNGLSGTIFNPWVYQGAGVHFQLPVSNLSFWTSHDILNTDGTTYLAASDPIPLDGYTVIEWDGNTEGLEELTLMGMSELYKVSDIIIPASSINSAIIVLSAGSSRVTLTPSSNRTYAVNSQIFDSEHLIEYYYGTLDGTTTRMNSLAAAVNIPSAGVTGSYFWAGTFAGSVDGYTPILAYKAT